MKLLLVLTLFVFSLPSFASNFICTAKVVENSQDISALSVEGFWRSSSSYENESVSVPKGAKKIVLDMELDGRTPNEPDFTFKVKTAKSHNLLKKIRIKKLGEVKKYKLGEKQYIEISCS